ncbi:MAG: histidinol-phosphate transaminase [Kiritimatiellaeota bacterium]|nr:histidinol-phosphate transaminase [Kiritimatiellota bacterium]
MSEYWNSRTKNIIPYTPGEQSKDRQFIKLNTNENPYPPSPAVGAALAALNPETLRLYPDPSCAAFREKLAALFGCAADNILVANGSDEALRLCSDAFVENDGAIGYFDPSYSLYPVLAAMRGVPGRPVSLWPEMIWKMPEGYAAPLFFLANPNAPTGMRFEKARVAAFCKDFPGVVVIDEAYADFARENALDLALTLPNVLVCRTLSKSYSLAGLRLGFLVGSTALIQALYKLKDSYNIDRIALTLAEAAVADQAHKDANVRHIIATRERVATELCARGWGVCPSETNFLWCRPPAGQNAAAVFTALREKSIIVRYWDAPHLDAYLRITVGTDSQMDALLANIEA